MIILTCPIQYLDLVYNYAEINDSEWMLQITWLA